MNDFSLMQKFNMLMNLISSSPLFFLCMIIGIIILTVLIICIVLNKKINKWLFIGGGSLVGILLFVNYSEIVIKVFDIILDSVFMALYFPNLPIYASIVFLSNISLAVGIFSKKKTKAQKISNIISAIILDFLLILIIDVVTKNNINIYEEVNLYTNSTLLILLELSMGIFVSWVLVNLFISAHIKLKKYDLKELPSMPEIIFD